jgi:hypothetical protein
VSWDIKQVFLPCYLQYLEINFEESCGFAMPFADIVENHFSV